MDTDKEVRSRKAASSMNMIVAAIVCCLIPFVKPAHPGILAWMGWLSAFAGWAVARGEMTEIDWCKEYHR